jgi:hypothetical protein
MTVKPWQELRARSKVRRQQIKEDTWAKLNAYADIEVLEAFNNGEHLRVRNLNGLVCDFWPSTGRWRTSPSEPLRNGGYEAIRIATP